jgi:acetolactate synthase-1/2/3 large subunit
MSGTTNSHGCSAVTAEKCATPADIAPALQRAHESGLPLLINVWVNPDAYAPGATNQTMYK